MTKRKNEVRWPSYLIYTLTLMSFFLVYIAISSIPTKKIYFSHFYNIFNVKENPLQRGISPSDERFTSKRKPKEQRTFLNKSSHRDEKNVKTIYIVNRPTWFHLDAFRECQHKCKIMKSSRTMPTVDAVLFLSGDLSDFNVREKPPKQIWVFVSMESPEFLTQSLFAWRRLFNWTMTYRRDSDMFFSHGSIVPKPFRNKDHINRSLEVNNAIKAHWLSKPFKAGWLVSNCHTKSGREIYTEELSKYIPVDKYGKCGPLKCARTNTTCLTIVNQQYKFYLSFENAFCRDYLTEKVYNVFRATNSVIPIVRGGTKYSMYFPPSSFIDAEDFKSAKMLGIFLKNLSESTSSYKKYFTHRHFYEPGNMDQRHFCHLCQRLHNLDKFARVYDDVVKWYRGSMAKRVCYTKKHYTPTPQHFQRSASSYQSNHEYRKH